MNDVASTAPRPSGDASPTGDALLTAQNVTKVFGGLVAVEDVDFEIPERRRQIELSAGIEDLAIDEESVYKARVP